MLTWHLPNLRMDRLPPGRYYAAKFADALGVARYVRQHFARLTSETHLWHDTWYDGSLPWWFLDRTFLNTSILATSTCYRFTNGRFYGWEGVGCCEGTCGHVWQYTHAMARLFPDLERMTRERVDFGLALQPNGAIHFRGEFNDIPAIDAQSGTVLRALREHQMSADGAFLIRNWPQIRRAVEWLIAKDENADGLIESNQHNTLDTDWYGPVAWLSGLYLAALRAAEQMATEVGDTAFAEKCRAIFTIGQKNIVAQLFQDGYFVNKPSPKHLDAINSGTGCHINQVMGQSWAFQVALPRVFPQKETLSALQSLWRYNFTPDVGPYREVYKAGRWYAMPGEAGLLMCTFPRSDWDYDQAKGKGADWAAGYFNECMNGFEYQVAGHMLWEGMVTEGLAVTRAVHDRYHASRRNPWNEVECGDHYARSMASYGVFLAACGFEYHGPRGHLGFAPRVHPEDFKAAFTAAEGWGTFSQKAGSNRLQCGSGDQLGQAAAAQPERGAAAQRFRQPGEGQCQRTRHRNQRIAGRHSADHHLQRVGGTRGSSEPRSRGRVNASAHASRITFHVSRFTYRPVIHPKATSKPHHALAFQSLNTLCHPFLNGRIRADDFYRSIPALPGAAPYREIYPAVVWRRAGGLDDLHVVLPGAAAGGLCLRALHFALAQAAHAGHRTPGPAGGRPVPAAHHPK